METNYSTSATMFNPNFSFLFFVITLQNLLDPINGTIVAVKLVQKYGKLCAIFFCCCCFEFPSQSLAFERSALIIVQLGHRTFHFILFYVLISVLDLIPSIWIQWLYKHKFNSSFKSALKFSQKIKIRKKLYKIWIQKKITINVCR